MSSLATIAILGASADRRKFGNKAVRAYAQAGWRVIPVNPRGGMIEGLPAVKRLAEIDVDLDRVSVYLPPEVTRGALPEIAAQGAGEVWLNPGSATASVVAEAEAAGLVVRAACSIVDIGMRPADYP